MFLRARKRQQGFTVTEVIVVMAIMTIIAGMALPPFVQWVAAAEYRAAARTIVSILRETRSMAITANLEHRVEFENENKRFRVVRGNRASNSNTWEDVIRDWEVLPPLVHMDANVEKIHLNPFGTSNAGTITIQDERAQPKFRVRINNTGRIRIL